MGADGPIYVVGGMVVSILPRNLIAGNWAQSLALEIHTNQPSPAAMCREGCLSNRTRKSRENGLIWPARSAIPFRRDSESMRQTPDLSGERLCDQSHKLARITRKSTSVGGEGGQQNGGISGYRRDPAVLSKVCLRLGKVARNLAAAWHK